jgi:molecular chaperone HscB
VQPVDNGADHFHVLGIARTFAVDLAAAEAQFKELSRRLHPDRFAKADPRARRASLQRTVQLNEAWRTLKDPTRRAEYLLERAGYAIGAEQGASAPGPAAGGTKAHATAAASARGGSADEGRVRIEAPQALLMDVLELREELADARVEGDTARIARLVGELQERSAEAFARVGAALKEAEDAAWGEAARPALETAARELIALRYFRRFLDDAGAGAERDSGLRVAHAGGELGMREGGGAR